MTDSADISWQHSPHARRCLTLGLLALLVGAACARPALLALAAVPIALILLADRHPAPRELHWSVEVPRRCFEHEGLTVTVAVRLPNPVDTLGLRVRPGRHASMTPIPEPDLVHTDSGELTEHVELSFDRWGRRQAGLVVIDLSACSGLRSAQLHLNVGEVAVFPAPAPMRRLNLAATRTDQVGEHVARVPGSGVEFAAIRPFAFGDSLTRINWPASLRSQTLQVTQTAAERGVDVVIVVDCFDDVGPAGCSSLDLSVRAATGIARLVLGYHDRVGVLALGGWLRWVRPSLGERQFYRVAEAMLDVVGRESYVDPDVTRVASGALPAGCVLVLISPLLDPRAVGAARALRSRGHPIVAVDVLTVTPRARDHFEEVAVRLWRLQREATRAGLTGIGIPVIEWDGATPLDARLRTTLRLATRFGSAR